MIMKINGIHKTTITFRLPLSMKEQLNEIARNLKKGFSEIIRESLEQHYKMKQQGLI